MGNIPESIVNAMQENAFQAEQLAVSPVDYSNAVMILRICKLH